MPDTEYKTTKSWNPFVGCSFDCTYCKPSFQDLIAWVGGMQNCEDCTRYAPHEHPERLTGKLEKIADKSIFVCEDGDISFAKPAFMKRVIEAMRADKKGRIWFLQSKQPTCFEQYLTQFPRNTYLVTTLETNRDNGYELVSKVPKPSERFKQFRALGWENKIVTVEPIMEFDLDIFEQWIVELKPKAVFVGYNSKPETVMLPEPEIGKTWELITRLRTKGFDVLEKDMRDATIPKKAYRDFLPNLLGDFV